MSLGTDYRSEMYIIGQNVKFVGKNLLDMIVNMITMEESTTF